MGCLVAKSTISYYEGEVFNTNALVGQIKDQIEIRKMQHELNELNQEEHIGYLAYQEQLRTSFNETRLSKLFPIEQKFEAPSESFTANFAAYTHLKSIQTGFEAELINELFSFIDKVKGMNENKKSDVESQISSMVEKKRMSKFKSSEQVLVGLRERVSDVEDSGSFEYLVETFVKRSEIDRELALIQRIYEFKGYVGKEEVKKVAHNDGTEALNTLKQENKKLNKELAALKADEEKFKKMMKKKNREIRKNEEILQKLMEDMQEIDEELNENPDVSHAFEQMLRKVSEKEEEMKELQEKVKEAEEKLKTVQTNLDFDELKQKSKLLKRQIEEVEHQVESLKAQKMKGIQEKIRLKHLNLEQKSKTIRDLKNNIKTNQEALAKAEIDVKYDIKKHVLVRLFRSIKRLRSNYFRLWKRMWIECRVSSQVIEESSAYLSIDSFKISVSWEPSKLYDFFNEFLREKVRSDKARIHNKKLPKTIKKYLNIYMKRLYKSTNDCEKEINKMIQTVNQEEKNDSLASIIKKMIGAGPHIQYHLDILLSQLWNEFNYYELQDSKEKSCLLFDAIKIAKDYLNPQYSLAGQKLVQKWKPESMDSEEFLILLLKYFMVSYDREFLSGFESSDKLISFLTEQVNIFVCEQDIERIFSEFSGQDVRVMLKYLTMAVNKVDETALVVLKSQFLMGIIEVFDESVLQGKLIVEKMLRSIEDLTAKDFESVIRQLEPELEAVLIQKMLSECVIDESSNMYSVSGEHLAEVIVKYGIGGLGVGPFMTDQLRTLLDQYLKREKKVKFDRRQSSDLVPYKINIESLESPSAVSNSINMMNSNNTNILDILPSRNIKILSVKRGKSPVPASGNKTNVPNKFFSSRGNSPLRSLSPNPDLQE